MKIKVGLLLCWLGIHRYKTIDSTFGFAPGGTEPLEKFNAKFVESKKLEKGKITPQLYETKTWKQCSLEIGSS